METILIYRCAGLRFVKTLHWLTDLCSGWFQISPWHLVTGFLSGHPEHSQHPRGLHAAWHGKWGVSSLPAVVPLSTTEAFCAAQHSGPCLFSWSFVVIVTHRVTSLRSQHHSQSTDRKRRPLLLCSLPHFFYRLLPDSPSYDLTLALKRQWVDYQPHNRMPSFVKWGNQGSGTKRDWFQVPESLRSKDAIGAQVPWILLLQVMLKYDRACPWLSCSTSSPPGLLNGQLCPSFLARTNQEQPSSVPQHIWRMTNLYASQEATVRTRQGTKDWFKIGKGIRQGCILSPCLFNLYAEYIMQNAGWSTSWNQDCREKYQ